MRAPYDPAREAARRDAARKASRRHSRRVRGLRLLVPGLGALMLLAIVAMIAVSSYLSGLGFGTVTITADGLVMDSPELSGHDGERSYKVSASRAIQRISDPRIIDLERIRRRSSPFGGPAGPHCRRTRQPITAPRKP